MAKDSIEQDLREDIHGSGEALIMKWDMRRRNSSTAIAEERSNALEKERIDVIYSVTTLVTIAVKAATNTTPIAFYAGTDPVVVGLVESFGSPVAASPASIAARRNWSPNGSSS